MQKNVIASLDPANFAFIMATGITSIMLYELGFPILSAIFFSLDVICYVFLFALFIVRPFILGKKIFAEFFKPVSLFKYFTFSAGSNLLATRFCLAGEDTIGLVLASFGTASTFFLVYTVFCSLLFHTTSSIQQISPVWLLMSIACHSTSIAISTLWDHQVIENQGVLVFSSCFFTFGLLVYLIFMALNLYRMFFLTFAGKDVHPAYWTCMGAAAIAVVDACKLLQLRDTPQFIELAHDFLGGFALILWAWGSAWIPILCMMVIWCYGYFKEPVRYYPSLWAMVFPLGMYTSASYNSAASLGLHLPQGFLLASLWVTVIVWLSVLSLSRFLPFQKEC